MTDMIGYLFNSTNRFVLVTESYVFIVR